MRLVEPRVVAEHSHADDDCYEVRLDGEVIFTTSYDAIGYAGFEALRELCEVLSEKLEKM
jgi:hypothetical protein